MTFPLPIELFGARIHPHLLFEGLGYFLGARLYFFLRRRAFRADKALPLETNLWLLVGCLAGAFLGSKLLAWVESPSVYLPLLGQPLALFGGKTIVGGLLGGWAGVELAKHFLRLRSSTGDLFVYPLALGTAIGRLGCFFTGLDDHTCGVATSLPWGVDFGDGLRRHPTQLYESAAVLLLALALLLVERIRRSRPLAAGQRFRLYMAGYLGFRFAVEFIKPRELIPPGLSAIQLACLIGIAFAVRDLIRRPAAPAPTN